MDKSHAILRAINRHTPHIFASQIGDDKYNLPGYCGPPHRELSSVPRWRVDRESEKHRMLLFDLDQHSRPYWPHWKGYKPQV